jgi:hypothetical protein
MVLRNPRGLPNISKTMKMGHLRKISGKYEVKPGDYGVLG